MLAKSNQRTMVSSADNNPLKFLPSAEEIIEAMFVRRRPGYLDANAVSRTLSAISRRTNLRPMRPCSQRLVACWTTFAGSHREKGAGFGLWFEKGPRLGCVCDDWETKEAAHENGMLDVFLAYFSEAYAKAVKPK